MSNWEDTVMDYDKILDKFGVTFNEEILNCSERLTEVAQAQAKISFKLGKEEEAKGGHNSISYFEGYKKGKQEGEREVVEELTHYNEGITLAQLSATNRWQAFKKERGL